MISRIEVEGIDKVGKDTLVGYLDYMSNRSIPISSRGILSTLAYNLIYDRNNELDYRQLVRDNGHTLIILLDAEIEDLEVRYKICHEPKIDIKKDMAIFEGLARGLEHEDGIDIFRYNTSHQTPYDIATDVVEYIRRENGWKC